MQRGDIALQEESQNNRKSFGMPSSLLTNFSCGDFSSTLLKYSGSKEMVCMTEKQSPNCRLTTNLISMYRCRSRLLQSCPLHHLWSILVSAKCYPGQKRTILVIHHVILKNLRADFAAMHRCVVAAVASRVRSRFHSWIKLHDSSISQDSNFMHHQHGSFFFCSG